MRDTIATEAYFIKLGRNGEWEESCLREGTLRLGYRLAPHDLCAAGNWQAVRTCMLDGRKNVGAGTRDTNQIRTFYEADDRTIFITFSGGSMYWCRAAPGVEPHASQAWRTRRTVDGWHDRSRAGEPFTSERLSGSLLKVRGFQGTICRVRAIDYLLRKIDDISIPEVDAAKDAENALLDAIKALMRLLTWQDFELLVDLVFSNSGWRRVGVVGRSEKTSDMELVLPTTGERAFVQVKSTTNRAEIEGYVEGFRSSRVFDRMFFAWHSGPTAAEAASPRVTLIGPDRLARMVLDAGLVSWLRSKAS